MEESPARVVAHEGPARPGGDAPRALAATLAAADRAGVGPGRLRYSRGGHWVIPPLAWRSRFALDGAGASSLSVPPILPLDYRLSTVYGYCMVKYLQANEREDG